MKLFRKSLIILALFLMVSSISTAQNSEPQKPTYEKKVFIDDKGDYYIQKSLPLYLFFSTTPEGQKHRLKSKSTPKYADPMYLDTEGHNTWRAPSAVDPTTLKTVYPMRDIVYDVYADGISPYTGVKFTGAPRYATRGVIYYGKGLNVTLTSSDAVSGVENTHYSINSGSYSTYSNVLNVSDEGAKKLHFYANDKVGNAEKTRSKSFTVDISSPKSSHEIVGIVYKGNIIAPSTKFKLSSTDNLSGVRTTYYSYDSRGRNVYGYPAGVSYLKDGDHTLNYYSVDRVKNEEAKNTFSFYLDKIPPVVTTTIEGDQHFGAYKYVSPRTKIKMTASDNKAGVESISYSIDYKGDNTYSSQFGVPDKKGVHSIRYFGTDNVKNRSSRKTLAVYMDNVAPTTGITYGSPKFFARDTLFINKNTYVSLFARDYESGVKKIEYSVDGAGFKEYSKFTIPPEGFHKITFKTTDKVNNVEQVKESEVFVDNTAPVIYHNFSIKSIGTKNKGGKALDVYPNYSRLYLGATDKHVGTSKITYSLDGKTFKDYSSPYTLDISELSLFRKNKFYSVTVRAKDKLGNESETVIEFYVGKKGD